MKTGMRKCTYGSRARKIVTTEMMMEVVTVIGFCGKEDVDGTDYWQNVWDFLNARYPWLFIVDEYPSRWFSDADHEKDMDILTYIHAWQIAKQRRSRDRGPLRRYGPGRTYR